METVRRVIISTLTIGAFGGVGAVLWLLVAPNEQRRLEMRKNFPEANPAVMAEVRKRNELVLQAIKEAAETNDNVSRKPPWGS
ncbi:ubiquinol-cytochrome-c reductase complex assembly factor 3-like [Spea bombifrons]|uniref:ubiquinol-cytochrome-c reductase complex assembly factor 3-like n=1 Tax=Spea bombifrons TaxID=233779 RepID=UPI00234B7704|nr:ubiquinol-cytochrome-c reductase complex assembly factor 3-like [Spea bombifrons]